MQSKPAFETRSRVFETSWGACCTDTPEKTMVAPSRAKARIRLLIGGLLVLGACARERRNPPPPLPERPPANVIVEGSVADPVRFGAPTPVELGRASGVDREHAMAGR